MALASSSTLAPRFLPMRLPKVCLALSGETIDDMLATAESMARDNPFLEFRLDYLKQPLAALPKIHRFLETHQYGTAIGTCRRADNDGKFKGSLASQLEVLTKAHAAGCQIVDLEIQSALKLKPDAIARLRSRARLILSFHDFRATRNLDETLGKMLKIPADFYKVVSTATTLLDNVTMMKFLQTQSDKHALIGICMGEQGIISRVLSVREIPLHGLSVTMPYKQAILPHLDNTDAHTTKIGACNTVVRGQDGKLYGFNTDAAGVVRPLEQRLAIEGAKVLVLGAGGAARAAVFGLKERGAEVWILNRTSLKAQKLARQAKARTIKRADLRKIAFDVIINATPVGMGNTRDCPLKDEEIQARVVFDMVYNPVETHLLQAARAKGIAVIPGVEMFVQQAARQFEIWTGKPAPAGDMLRAVTITLQDRAADQKKS